MKVLFVDDDVKLLNSLRRMSLSQEGLAASFAQSGAQALEMLDAEHFDAVVADMLMPGMDGAKLLKHVQDRHPDTVRIVLSGHSDQAMILRSVKPAHQFLSKPCPFNEIMAVLGRLHSLRSLLTKQEILSLVNRIDALPTLPHIYLELMQEINSEQRSLAKIGEIIARDPAMATGILKVVNSSFFGLPRAIATPQQAVTYLGEDLLRGLVLSYKLVSTLNAAKHPDFHPSLLWQHSLNTAFFCRAICQDESLAANMDDSLNAGLLHDVGKIVLLHTLPNEFNAVVTEARRKNSGLAAAEKKFLGVTHAELGAYLLGLWGFHNELVLAVAGHHSPGEYAGQSRLLPVLHAANVFEHELVVINPHHHKPGLDTKFLASQGLEQAADKWREACKASLESAS